MYRIEVSDTPVKNISEFPAIMVSFDRVGSKNALNVIAENGLLIYGDERHEQVP